jgi:hypothetical protein
VVTLFLFVPKAERTLMKRRHELTAKEHGEVLAKDPKYLGAIEEREQQRAALRETLNAEQKPLVEAISVAWRPVRSIDDLVHTAESYPEVVPILAAHLQRQYHPLIREAIARALSVEEARGKPARIVLEQLNQLVQPKNAQEDCYRFALVNALVTIGDASMMEDIDQMLKDARYAKVRTRLERARKAISKRAGLAGPRL